MTHLSSAETYDPVLRQLAIETIRDGVEEPAAISDLRERVRKLEEQLEEQKAKRKSDPETADPNE